MRLPLPSLFFFFPPHQKALNQFHALQMLFTLLGVKHLLFAPLGFLSFFLLADSLRLFFFFLPSKKGDFIKTLVAAQHLVWERSIAHDAPPQKRKQKKIGLALTRFLPSMARDVATLYCSFHQQSQIVPQSVSCIQRLLGVPSMFLYQFFWVFFSFPREFISEVWRDFTINNNSRDLQVFHETPIFLWNIKQAQWEALSGSLARFSFSFLPTCYSHCSGRCRI